MEEKARPLSKALNDINAFLEEEIGIGIDIVNPSDLVTLSSDENARFMDDRTFEQLVNNLKSDKTLSSAPLCTVQDGKYKVLSGNHRVKAAIEAGIEKIVILYLPKPVSKEKQIAIQLSHNAIVGQDNLSTLARLYRSISDIDLKKYSGLDDKTLSIIKNIDFSLPKPAIPKFITVPLVFVSRDEIKQVEAFVEYADKQAKNGYIFVAPDETFERFVRAVSKKRDELNVINFTTAVLYIIQEVLENGTPNDIG